MAPDLTICTSTNAAESDEDRVKLTPSTSYCSTPRISSAPEAEQCSEMLYSNPWTSENSPRSAAGTQRPNPNSKAVPIITLKPRHLSGGRDQAAVDEVWQLKRALPEEDTELRRRQVHSANVDAENRKMVKDIEQVFDATEESNSNQRGSCTGSPSKLQAKLAGIKVMLEEAYNTCELQSIELYNLRRDVSLTHAHEVERNVYAAEVRRLQAVIKQLQVANGRVGHESRVIGRLKAKNHHLEVMNLRLSSCLSVSFSQIPTTPRTQRVQLSQRNALIQNSFDGFDCIQQQQQQQLSRKMPV